MNLPGLQTTGQFFVERYRHSSATDEEVSAEFVSSQS
jgi:hypothetical protein